MAYEQRHKHSSESLSRLIFETLSGSYSYYLHFMLFKKLFIYLFGCAGA